ncbi:XRE family transcriptional regulator [Kordiimonas sp.]|uniref:XRE family transcriptional regulator n=1 Tax=Kordiimonas sp. TaxID=1970157 RepID=UPI003A92FD10
MENRLKEIRERKGLSQTELADAIGTTQGQIYKLESGSVRLSDVWLERLAPVLGVPQGALLSDGAGFETLRTSIREIPVIDYVQAGGYVSSANPYPKGEGMETILFDYKHNKIFGLRVQGNSMDRVFKEGTTLIVDYTDTDLHDRKYYVISNGDGTSVKQYRANPIRFEPQSFADEYDTIFPDQNTRIIGRVVHFLGEC